MILLVSGPHDYHDRAALYARLDAIRPSRVVTDGKGTRYPGWDAYDRDGVGAFAMEWCLARGVEVLVDPKRRRMALLQAHGADRVLVVGADDALEGVARRDGIPVEVLR